MDRGKGKCKCKSWAWGKGEGKGKGKSYARARARARGKKIACGCAAFFNYVMNHSFYPGIGIFKVHYVCFKGNEPIISR